jgi:hypothetical protein
MVEGLDGTPRRADAGAVLHTGETVLTGADGTLHLCLGDGSTIHVGPQASLVIDAFRWEDQDADPLLTLFLAEGSLTFFPGVIAQSDFASIVIATPVGSIDVNRGGLAVEIAGKRGLRVKLAAGVDGTVGEAVVLGAKGTHVLDSTKDSVEIVTAATVTFLRRF